MVYLGKNDHPNLFKEMYLGAPDSGHISVGESFGQVQFTCTATLLNVPL